MSSKALRSQLLAAVVMVLVAAIALGSSTFAWFAMNKTVTADGMSVTAKSNDTFLLISQTENTAGAIQDEAAEDSSNHGTKTTFTISDDAVYPSKPWADGDATTYTHVTTATPVTTQEAAETVGNWITANSNDPAVAVSGTHGDKALDSFSGYVLKQTVYLTLAKGSDVAHNLTVTPSIAKKEGAPETSVIDAVKVLVVTNDDNIVTLDKASEKTNLYGVADTQLTDSSVVTVDIYVYYDDSDESVTSNKAANLAGASISLQFDVEVGTATTT